MNMVLCSISWDLIAFCVSFLYLYSNYTRIIIIFILYNVCDIMLYVICYILYVCYNVGYVVFNIYIPVNIFIYYLYYLYFEYIVNVIYLNILLNKSIHP